MDTAGRQVVLGISGPDVAHLIDWAALLVRPADTVYITYASELEPAIRLAGARLRRHRPDLAVFEGSTSGPAALIDAARGADLVILATPHLDRDRAVLARLLAEVDCPVAVTAPARPVPVRSVTVILRGDQDDDALVEMAYAQASRYDCGVLAVKSWQPPPDGGAYYAEIAEQKELDSYLAGWQERFPDVGIAAELRVGELIRALDDGASGADLLILAVSRPGPTSLDPVLDPVLDAVLADRSHSTVLIPGPAGSQRALLNGRPRAEARLDVVRSR